MASSFQIQQQMYSRWCWAAVGASTKLYLSPDSPLTQCRLAARVTGDDGCCDAHLPPGLDRSEPLQNALDDASVPYQTLPGIALAFAAIRTQINESLPVCARIGWPGQNAGHFVVVYGFGVSPSGEQWVDIADPFYGYWTVPYEYFIHSYQGDGEWTDSFLVQAPPAGGK
jgi:hypothetical protein